MKQSLVLSVISVLDNFTYNKVTLWINIKHPALKVHDPSNVMFHRGHIANMNGFAKSLFCKLLTEKKSSI